MPLINTPVWLQSLWRNRTLRPYLISLAVGTLCLFVPLLRNFHLESAMAASVAGSIAAIARANKLSYTSLAATSQALRAFFKISSYLYLAALPLLASDLITGCFSVHGLGFWLLIPLPAILLMFSASRLIRLYKLPVPSILAALLFVLIAIGQWLIEFYTFPQVYFYNHIWGYWPGPIYDETVTLPFAMIYFRLLTLAWILLLWFIPEMSRSRISKWVLGLSFLLLAIGYSQLQEMRLITPRKQLKSAFGGQIQTEHFTIYYDDRLYDCDQIKYWASRHELYYKQITEALNLFPDAGPRIESYIYAHPWQKKKWVGAKYTSYVPVWQQQDQLHLAYPQLRSSLKHEMVHVIAKSFGNRLINASWNIGMVEGLAVALAPDVHNELTLDQIVAGGKPYPEARQIKNMMSFGGFYLGRSNVGYLTAGSLIQYLLNEYDPASFKRAYRTNNLQEGYDRPVDSLIAGWHSHLQNTPVDSAARATADRLFGMASIFEKPCPHTVSLEQQIQDRFNHLLAGHDSLKAIEFLRNTLSGTDGMRARAQDYLWYRLGLESIRHARFDQSGYPELTPSSSALLRTLYADYEFLKTNSFTKARQILSGAADSININRPAITRVRADSLQWAHWLKLRYKQTALKADELLSSNPALQRYNIELIRSTSTIDVLSAYSEQPKANITKLPPDIRLLLAESLVLYNLTGEAERILGTISAQSPSLTPKQRETLTRLKSEIRLYNLNDFTVKCIE